MRNLGFHGPARCRLKGPYHAAGLLLLLLAQIFALASCSLLAPIQSVDTLLPPQPAQALEVHQDPSPTVFAPLPTEPVPIDLHAGALRFMSYNIQFGAGYTRRLDRVMEVLQAYRPDILALQELNRWGVGEPARISLVAEALGMQYVFCDSDSQASDDPNNSFDIAVLTQFEIVDADTYPDVVHCLVRADVLLPDGSHLQVFNVHFRPNFSDTGCRNPEKMLEITGPYLAQNTVILGDFNLPGPTGDSPGFLPVQAECAQRIQAAGWALIAQNVIEIDQLWVSPALQAHQFQPYPGPRQDPLLSYQALATASDHFPLAVDMVFP